MLIGSSPNLSFGPVVQLVRTPACHAGGRQFEPDPGRHAAVAQSVERILGKDEVGSSNLPSSSTKSPVTAMVAGLLILSAFYIFWVLGVNLG